MVCLETWVVGDSGPVLDGLVASAADGDSCGDFSEGTGLRRRGG